MAKKILTEVRAVYGKKKWMKSTIKGKHLLISLQQWWCLFCQVTFFVKRFEDRARTEDKLGFVFQAKMWPGYQSQTKQYKILQAY